MPDYLNTQKVAEILGITARQVRRHCAEGRLGEWISPSWKVTQEDADQFNEIDRPIGHPGRAAKKSAALKRDSEKVYNVTSKQTEN